MSTLEAIVGAIGLAFLSIVILPEVPPLCAYLASQLLNASIGRLPERLQERRREEWQANLDSMTGLKLYRLAWAISCWWGAVRVARAEPKPEPIRLTGPVVSRLLVIRRFDGTHEWVDIQGKLPDHGGEFEFIRSWAHNNPSRDVAEIECVAPGCRPITTASVRISGGTGTELTLPGPVPPKYKMRRRTFDDDTPN